MMRYLILALIAGCTVPPPQDTKADTLPILVIEERIPEPEPPKKKPEPKKQTEAKKPEKKADNLCPPVEGETDQQRIIRKLDCLLERD